MSCFNVTLTVLYKQLCIEHNVFSKLGSCNVQYDAIIPVKKRGFAFSMLAVALFIFYLINYYMKRNAQLISVLLLVTIIVTLL